MNFIIFNQLTFRVFGVCAPSWLYVVLVVVHLLLALKEKRLASLPLCLDLVRVIGQFDNLRSLATNILTLLLHGVLWGLSSHYQASASHDVFVIFACLFVLIDIEECHVVSLIRGANLLSFRQKVKHFLSRDRL